MLVISKITYQDFTVLCNGGRGREGMEWGEKSIYHDCPIRGGGGRDGGGGAEERQRGCLLDTLPKTKGNIFFSHIFTSTCFFTSASAKTSLQRSSWKEEEEEKTRYIRFFFLRRNLRIAGKERRRYVRVSTFVSTFVSLDCLYLSIRLCFLKRRRGGRHLHFFFWPKMRRKETAKERRRWVGDATAVFLPLFLLPCQDFPLSLSLSHSQCGGQVYEYRMQHVCIYSRYSGLR